MDMPLKIPDLWLFKAVAPVLLIINGWQATAAL